MKLRLLLELEKGSTWKETRLYLSYGGWYKAEKILKEKGLICEAGTDEKGRKIWKLTDRGKELVNYMKKIMEILGEDYDIEVISK
ncbi:MAG: hypothetical protein C0172_02710 [Caldisphaera sp.]|nr:MAG: hypothetical protein C0172_02710 [Caldisphaera sp.]